MIRASAIVGRISIGAAGWLPLAAWPHAFDDRYDLPAPLSFFVYGAAAAVVLSFVVAALFARAAPAVPSAPLVLPLGPLLPLLRAFGGLSSVLVLAATIAAGWLGTRDPMMNLAPTLVWIVWWVGLSLLVACIGNVWPALDPWRALYGVLDGMLRGLGRRQGANLGCPYPAWLGSWPAVLLLLGVAWIELVYPEAASPRRIAHIVLAWSACTVAGMVCFGPEVWRRHADVFAVYFDTLGRFAPLAAASDRRSLELRVPGRGLLDAGPATLAITAFVMAMLSTTLFDGLLSGPFWRALQQLMVKTVPVTFDSAGYTGGTLGLVGLWLAFVAAYTTACAIAARCATGHTTASVARAFVLTLVPIAVAYNVAHNFSYLLVQGQQLIPLLSDPLGRNWNLFGTAGYRANIGIIDARVTWHVAIGAVIAGHGVSIWLAHRVALREFGSPRRALLASLPLTALMVCFTILSLSVIAEPMVKFGVPDATGAITGPAVTAA